MGRQRPTKSGNLSAEGNAQLGKRSPGGTAEVVWVSNFRWAPPPGSCGDPGETRNSEMGRLHLSSPCVRLGSSPLASPGASRLGPHTPRIRESMPSPGDGARPSDRSL